MKRIAAVIGIVLLVGLYISTLVFALIGNAFATNMLKASVFATIFLPVILYCIIFLSKAFDKKNHND